MASDIVSTTIDENFPVPGVDNDTQGFRDNFDIIKTALAVATVEIGDLQDDTAKLNVGNNFDGNLIDSAVLRKSGDAVSSSDNTTLLWTDAVYHAHTVAESTEFIMKNWAAVAAPPKQDMVGKMVVEVTADVTAEVAPSVTFTARVGTSDINGVIKLPAGVANPVTLAIGTTNIYEFWTIDGGVTVYGKLVGSYAPIT